MWRVPVSPPIPVYTREVKDEFETYLRTRRSKQIIWNAPPGNIEYRQDCPVGFRHILRRIVVQNNGAGPVNIDFTFFDKHDFAYCFWADNSGVLGNICIIYAENCDTAAVTGSPQRWTRPLGIDRLDELEAFEMLIAVGAADAGSVTVWYDEVKDIGM